MGQEEQDSPEYSKDKDSSAGSSQRLAKRLLISAHLAYLKMQNLAVWKRVLGPLVLLCIMLWWLSVKHRQHGQVRVAV